MSFNSRAEKQVKNAVAAERMAHQLQLSRPQGAANPRWKDYRSISRSSTGRTIHILARKDTEMRSLQIPKLSIGNQGMWTAL